MGPARWTLRRLGRIRAALLGAGRFERWGRWITHHRSAALLGCLLAGLAFAAGLPRIGFETHAERFLAPDHPERRRYEAFKQEFGLDTAILLVFETEDIFDPGFLSALRVIHERIEAETP